MTDIDLMQCLEQFEGASADGYLPELMDDYSDLIGTRVARTVADALMFAPLFSMDEAFRERLITRFFSQ